MRQLSVLFERSTATLMGVSARNSAANRPASSPNAAPHLDIDQQDGDQAFNHLRQQHGQAVEPDQLGRGDLQPERDRRLVERDEARGVECVEEEIVPAPEHAAHARRVVGAALAVLRQPQRAQDEPPARGCRPGPTAPAKRAHAPSPQCRGALQPACRPAPIANSGRNARQRTRPSVRPFEPARELQDREPAYVPDSTTGVQSTCSMRVAPVASMTRRSKPSAAPLAGGMCASAARKSSSIG